MAVTIQVLSPGDRLTEEIFGVVAVPGVQHAAVGAGVDPRHTGVGAVVIGLVTASDDVRVAVVVDVTRAIHRDPQLVRRVIAVPLVDDRAIGAAVERDLTGVVAADVLGQRDTRLASGAGDQLLIAGQQRSQHRGDVGRADVIQVDDGRIEGRAGGDCGRLNVLSEHDPNELVLNDESVTI